MGFFNSLRIQCTLGTLHSHNRLKFFLIQLIFDLFEVKKEGSKAYFYINKIKNHECTKSKPGS